MAKSDPVFVYVGTYPNEGAARADYDVVKDLTPRALSAPTMRRSSRRIPMARSTSTRTRRRPVTVPGAEQRLVHSLASSSRRRSSSVLQLVRRSAG